MGSLAVHTTLKASYILISCGRELWEKNKKKIFFFKKKKRLYGIIAGIVGVVIGIALILPNLTDFLMKVYPSWNGDLTTITSLSGMIPNTNIGVGDFIPFITAAILAIAILWVFAIIATFFVRRSLKQLSVKTNVGLFSTAGVLLLIGAVLIIVGLGLLLMWIGVLILAIAFFRIRSQET
jgi:hypothetical protein